MKFKDYHLCFYISSIGNTSSVGNTMTKHFVKLKTSQLKILPIHQIYRLSIIAIIQYDVHAKQTVINVIPFTILMLFYLQTQATFNYSNECVGLLYKATVCRS